MASGVYNTYKAKDGSDWAAGAASAYKAMLVTGSYTPDADHDFPNATGLASNEVAGTTRQDVASRSKAINDTSNAAEHSANNVTFTGLSGSQPRYVVVYRAVTNDTDHQLVCWIDLGTGLNITGSLTVKWNGGASSGIVFSSS